MNRRKFGLLAGTSAASLATASTLRPAFAQTAADPNLLKTTLTPMGAERAGNADGSIPAWTGGLSAPENPEGTSWDCPLPFPKGSPIYTVTKDNLAQYADIVPVGIQAQITNWGMSLQVYETRRTYAAPQYVYDNTALNVTRTKIPAGGPRYGFTGAFAGPPFPIPDTSDPYVAGAQIIWNHLIAWSGFTFRNTGGPAFVVEGNSVVLASNAYNNFHYPYYDPNGSAETYQGYADYLHSTDFAPANIQGQELIIWHTSNSTIHPDIAWQLLNGEARVRKAPNEAFDIPNAGTNGIGNLDENVCFYGNPIQYDWKYIGKKEMLVPYHCNDLRYAEYRPVLTPHFVNPDYVRWEKHRVWVIEATLHPGFRNVTSKRRFYVDEDSWFALVGEGYDSGGGLEKVYMIQNACFPTLPGTVQQTSLVFNIQTGNYAYNGPIKIDGVVTLQIRDNMSPAEFNPSAMAANSSF